MDKAPFVADFLRDRQSSPEIAFAYRFVKLKLITLPMRLMVKVHPKAMANSLFLNQYAVMAFCAIVIEPPPRPKMNLPINIKMYRWSGVREVKVNANPNNAEPTKQKLKKRNTQVFSPTRSTMIPATRLMAMFVQA